MNWILAGLVGPVMIAAGWNAWTGRWRSWAHPYSGKGLVPLALLPIGAALITAVFIDPNRRDLAVWETLVLVSVMIPAAPAIVIAGVTMFYTPKRWPAFLRPRWLPQDWRPPVWVDARAVGIKARFGPAFRPSSVELAAQTPDASGALDRWHAFYEEDDPEVPYLHLGLTGTRWCEVVVYPRLVTIAQVVHEDRLHERPFLVTVSPGEVLAMTFTPGQPLSWRSIRARAQFPRLAIETVSGVYRLAFQPRLGVKVSRRVHRLEEVLGVTARR